MTTNTGQAARTSAFTNVGDRSLAPDLARGFMLLAIALAHTPLMLSDKDLGIGWLNGITEFLNTVLVSNQARPLFVFLFGYGLSQLALRQQQRGQQWTAIRKLLRRRGFWLLVIGFAHCVLTVPLDIVAVYGLALLLCAGLVRAKDSTLIWVAGIVFIPATAVAAFGLMFNEISGGNAGMLGPTMRDDPVASTLANLASWPYGVLVALPMVIPGMLLGVWAGRRRVLDEPRRHVALLRRASVGFLGVAILTRLPVALVFTGPWTGAPDGAKLALAIVHAVTGYFGGIGMAALIAVIAMRLTDSGGHVTAALAALGQRSLTFYVFQSVLFVVLFYPFAFDLRDDLGFAGASAVAAGIWLVSIVLAAWMRHQGIRGPLETLLRKLSYRRT